MAPRVAIRCDHARDSVTTYRFIGSEADLLFPDGHVLSLDEYGQKVDLTEAERSLFARVPLLTDEDYKKLRITPAEEAAYPSTQSVANAPDDYLAKRMAGAKLLAAIWERFHRTGSFD